MLLASSKDHLPPWFTMTGTRGRPSRMNANDPREPAQGGAAYASRSAVPWHEQLLLAGVLLTVAAWITFRLVMLLIATFG